MRERDAGIIRHGRNRGNARDNFKRNARRRERLGFLAATAKDVRIAALEAHDAFAFARLGDHPRVQIVLRNLPPFAARNQFTVLARQSQQFRVHEQIVNHHVRAPQQFRTA